MTTYTKLLILDKIMEGDIVCSESLHPSVVDNSSDFFFNFRPMDCGNSISKNGFRIDFNSWGKSYWSVKTARREIIRHFNGTKAKFNIWRKGHGGIFPQPKITVGLSNIDRLPLP